MSIKNAGAQVANKMEELEDSKLICCQYKTAKDSPIKEHPENSLDKISGRK